MTMASLRRKSSSRNNSPSYSAPNRPDSIISSSRHHSSNHGSTDNSLTATVGLALVNMTSWIKRKSGIRNTSLPNQSPTALNASSGQLARFNTTAAAVRALLLAVVLIFPLSLFLRSSLSRFSSTRNSHPHPRSFSALVEQMEKELFRDGNKYGEIPLTGVYTLGEDHLLQNSGATASEKNHAFVTGSIQFPHLDLSTVLKEEATEAASQLMSHFARPMFQKGTIPKSDDSFLSHDSTFESAIATNSHLTSPLGDDHALLTRCGYKTGKVPNQDRSLIAHFSLGQSDKRALLLGIFDGHGPRGHVVSHYIALELPRIFAKIMRQKQKSLHQSLLDSIGNPTEDGTLVDNIRQALNETFLEVDAHEPIKGTGGSTASTLFYPGLGSKVYIANAGDSTTLIARYSKSKKTSAIIFKNVSHKPHLEGERARIERAGGHVMIPPSILLGGGGGDEPKETSRVLIPDPDGNPFGALALAMSRSIGDFDGKSVGLIAEPDVIPWDVNDYYQNTSSEEKDDSMFFAVVASDGVYDFLNPGIVVNHLGRSLYHDGNGSDISPLEACERIIREASRMWARATMGSMPYRDDITIGVSKLNLS